MDYLAKLKSLKVALDNPWRSHNADEPSANTLARLVGDLVKLLIAKEEANETRTLRSLDEGAGERRV